MSIKYAVLGLLAESPLHGYAVHSQFEERLSDFWELNYGQVYQVLTLLEREEFVAARDERVGKRPTRKVYAVTAKGRAALSAWIARRIERRRPFRDDFYVRLLFVDKEDPARMRELVDAELANCRERLAELVDRRDRYARTGAVSLASRLFAKAAVLHAEADLEALRECRVALTRCEEAATTSRDAKVETTSLAPHRSVRR